MVNEIASKADTTQGRLEIYFSHVGFVYDKTSWFPLLERYLKHGTRKDEHGFALISTVESGASEQDMFNPLMKELGDDYVRKKGIAW